MLRTTVADAGERRKRNPKTMSQDLTIEYLQIGVTDQLETVQIEIKLEMIDELLFQVPEVGQEERLSSDTS